MTHRLAPELWELWPTAVEDLQPQELRCLHGAFSRAVVQSQAPLLWCPAHRAAVGGVQTVRSWKTCSEAVFLPPTWPDGMNEEAVLQAARKAGMAVAALEPFIVQVR